MEAGDRLVGRQGAAIASDRGSQGGRQRKLGKLSSGGGCLVVLTLLVVIPVALVTLLNRVVLTKAAPPPQAEWACETRPSF